MRTITVKEMAASKGIAESTARKYLDQAVHRQELKRIKDSSGKVTYYYPNGSDWLKFNDPFHLIGRNDGKDLQCLQPILAVHANITEGVDRNLPSKEDLRQYFLKRHIKESP